MATRIGRVSLTTPLDIRQLRSGADGGVAGPFYEEGYSVRGREASAAPDTTTDALRKEGLRRSYVWCEDDDSLFPGGHYRIEDVSPGDKEGGAPKRRPWDLRIMRRHVAPYLLRECESDNIAGTDTPDVEAGEESKVVYTPTTSEVIVLQPRTMANAEEFNVRGGLTYKAVARVQSRTTTSQKYRWRVTDLAGTAIATGAQKTVATAGAWIHLDLGDLAVPAANDLANWFEVHVQGVVAELNDVWLDRVRFVPV